MPILEECPSGDIQPVPSTLDRLALTKESTQLRLLRKTADKLGQDPNNPTNIIAATQRLIKCANGMNGNQAERLGEIHYDVFNNAATGDFPSQTIADLHELIEEVLAA